MSRTFGHRIKANTLERIAGGVTLADGSVQRVLAPQVYIRRAADQDLSVSGALMSGTDVRILSTSDIANSGTIVGDQVTLGSDQDIVNRGQVRGTQVLASAGRDLSNLGGSIQADGEATLLAGYVFTPPPQHDSPSVAPSRRSKRQQSRERRESADTAWR